MRLYQVRRSQKLESGVKALCWPVRDTHHAPTCLDRSILLLYLQRGVLEESLVMRRDAERLYRHVQGVGPLLVPRRDGGLRAAELRALAVSRLLPLLVLRGSPTRLHFVVFFFCRARVVCFRASRFDEVLSFPCHHGEGWGGVG